MTGGRNVGRNVDDSPLWSGAQTNSRETPPERDGVHKQGAGYGRDSQIHERDKSYGMSDGRHGHDLAHHEVSGVDAKAILNNPHIGGMGNLPKRLGHHGGGHARIGHAQAQAEMGGFPRVGDSATTPALEDDTTPAAAALEGGTETGRA